MIATFVSCFCIGFYLVPNSKGLDLIPESGGSNPQKVTGIEDKKVTGIKDKENTGIREKKDTGIGGIGGKEDTGSKKDSKPDDYYVPKIISYEVHSLKDKDPRFTYKYKLSVKATVKSNDPLEYRLCKKGTQEVKYTSATGEFTKIIDSTVTGEYDLVVVNTNTKDKCIKTISGFKGDGYEADKPKIESYKVTPLKRFGYRLSVKATVESNAPLEYRLCTKGTQDAKYTSTTGEFGNISPTASGKYDLIVVNTNTHHKAIRTISGFDMMNKLSAKELETKLNNNISRDFYDYFVNPKQVVITYVSLPDGIPAPSNLDALLNDRAANGWTLEVPSTPEYDDFNRIKKFTVKIIEN